ncbi:uncharacterized protein [Eleutherodactylus coqui]|uniref:uncharacterized protein isoform X2 n=1 Tax=Eleutherodactylus coqui TaxID=57060 RepID=UPI0034625575
MEELMRMIKDVVASQGTSWLVKMAEDLSGTTAAEEGASTSQPVLPSSEEPRGRPTRRRNPPARLSPSPVAKRGGRNSSPRPERLGGNSAVRSQRGREEAEPAERMGVGEPEVAERTTLTRGDIRQGERGSRPGNRMSACGATMSRSPRSRRVPQESGTARYAREYQQTSLPAPNVPLAMPEVNEAGESFQLNKVWDNVSGTSRKDEFMVALRALVDKYDMDKGLLVSYDKPGRAASPEVGGPAQGQRCLPSVAGVSEGLKLADSLFCGVAPLDAGLENEVVSKIINGNYVDIWSLLSVEHVSVDRERFTERGSEKKPKVAKTFGNWLQAFLILAHVVCKQQPQKGPELLVYINTIHSAYKLHGGSAWWRYDEDFRRRISGSQQISWASKATDVWIQLILAQKPVKHSFQGSAAGASGQQAAAAPKPSGSCWAFNEGHCRFYASCKFRHECSVCGGSHTALRCFRRQRATGVPGTGANAGERPVPGAVARPVPTETGSKPA